MMSALLSLREDYWEEFELEEKDIAFLYDYLLEKETPLTSEELMPILLEQRIEREKVQLEEQRLDGNEVYLPKEQYTEGAGLVFPAFDWQKGQVVGTREGENPALGTFQVIQVAFEDGKERELATGIEEHVLNEPPETDQAESLNVEMVIEQYGEELVERIEEGLAEMDEFVQIAGRWFLRALLVNVNVGHLNLAEAVLDMHQGGPLSI